MKLSFTDPVIRYALEWAVLMEKETEKGQKLEDVAEVTNKEAIKKYCPDLTNSAYFFALQILTHIWVHGEELRQWHNLSIDEVVGARANKIPGAMIDSTQIILHVGE